jgi:hypothetical protein
MEMTDSEIREWLDYINVYDYDICDGVVHVVGDVDISGLDSIPVQFGYVSGDFDCYGNKLTSLEGCPSEVGGSFDCSNNNLKSLKGCPSEVGGHFYCSYNNLKSLKGCPSEVGGHFDCNDNQLTSLNGGPMEVGGNFNCSYNMFKAKPDTSGIKVGGTLYVAG